MTEPKGVINYDVSKSRSKPHLYSYKNLLKILDSDRYSKGFEYRTFKVRKRNETSTPNKLVIEITSLGGITVAYKREPTRLTVAASFRSTADKLWVDKGKYYAATRLLMFLGKGDSEIIRLLGGYNEEEANRFVHQYTFMPRLTNPTEWYSDKIEYHIVNAVLAIAKQIVPRKRGGTGSNVEWMENVTENMIW
jgi:hypothetical protein